MTQDPEVERLARLMHLEAMKWVEAHPKGEDDREVVKLHPFDGLTKRHQAVYRAVAAAVIAELAGPVFVVGG